MGAESGPTVHSMAADYLRQAYNKPGNVFVGIVSRLDAMTSGVLVLARTSKAAARLSSQFSTISGSQKKATKIYVALIQGQLASAKGVLTDHVLKDDSAKRMRVVPEGTAGAQQAQLHFHVLHADGEHTLVAVKLGTGRKHQIRLQFAERGHPVLGDRKYGARLPFGDGIALHSFLLQVSHPTRDLRMTWAAETPKSWHSILQKLGAHHSLSDQVAALGWQPKGDGVEPIS